MGLLLKTIILPSGSICAVFPVFDSLSWIDGLTNDGK